MTRPPTGLAIAALAAAVLPAASAQTTHLQTPWPADPAFSAGDFEQIVAGRFHRDDLGRSAVVRRGGRLFLAYQPALFRHVTVAGPDGVTAMSTVEGLPGRRDRLAVVDATGLWLASFDGQGFVAEGTANPSFAGASLVGSAPATFGATSGHAIAALVGANTIVTGWQSSTSTTVATTATFAALGGTVFDVAMVDYDADTAPEIAVLHSGGMTVHDGDGTVVQDFAIPIDGGRITASNGVAAVVAEYAGTSSLLLAFGTTLVPCGMFAPGTDVIGVAAVDVDGDGDVEVVASTSDAVSLVHGMSGAAILTSSATVLDHHTSGMSPTPGVLSNAAPCFDDVNHDGSADLLIPDAATDSLIAIVSAHAVMLSIPAADPEPSVSVEGPILIYDDTDESETDVILELDVSAMLATHDQVHVQVWTHTNPGPSPDSVQLTKVSSTIWEDPGGSGPRFINCRVPIQATYDLAGMLHWADADHVWAEIRPVDFDAATGKLTHAGESVLVGMTVRPVPSPAANYADFLTGLDTSGTPPMTVDAINHSFESSSGSELGGPTTTQRQIGVGVRPKSPPPVEFSVTPLGPPAPLPVEPMKVAGGS